ncbi:hypothetical protein HBI64_060030 [Parastagonospora nodorum]|nr:hypothetical protein HBH42_023410 [Parastagonospora nodorum]KAH5276434.1 hypothetical protein HBI71_026720 [Parastagonospora nodorum]KAH5325713.1 hypothetical protein HBI11_032450 [Parastagonospora nodorum]KAH5336812.1 hypothetical protein HBI50_012750 [Parastagonospora nodorum]KAH6134620.1 hypothetical protein HBI64_060030 [Parastagonospora nodorum]
MTSCQHLTLPQQYQHIVDSELEPPVPHYQYVMSSLTDTYPCLHRSNIKSTTLTSTCINFSNITHLHNTSTCIDSSHTTSCSLNRLHLTGTLGSYSTVDNPSLPHTDR